MFLVPSCAKGAPRLCYLLGPLHLHAAPGRRDSARSALTAATEGACHGSVSATPWSLRSPGAPGEGQPCRAGAVPTVDPAFSALTGGAGGWRGAASQGPFAESTWAGSARLCPDQGAVPGACSAESPAQAGPEQPFPTRLRRESNPSQQTEPVASCERLSGPDGHPARPAGSWTLGAGLRVSFSPSASGFCTGSQPRLRGEGGPPASGRCCLSFKGKMFMRSRGRPLIEASLSEGVCSEVGVRPPRKGPV